MANIKDLKTLIGEGKLEPHKTFDDVFEDTKNFFNEYKDHDAKEAHATQAFREEYEASFSTKATIDEAKAMAAKVNEMEKIAAVEKLESRFPEKYERSADDFITNIIERQKHENEVEATRILTELHERADLAMMAEPPKDPEPLLGSLRFNKDTNSVFMWSGSDWVETAGDPYKQGAMASVNLAGNLTGNITGSVDEAVSLDGSCHTIAASVQPNQLIINGADYSPMVTIDTKTGEVDLSDDYRPSAAAKTFWTSMGLFSQMNPNEEYDVLVNKVDDYIETVVTPEIEKAHGETEFYLAQLDDLSEFLVANNGEDICGSSIETAISIIKKWNHWEKFGKTPNEVEPQDAPTSVHNDDDAYNLAMGVMK